MKARNVGRFMWTSISFAFMLTTVLLAAVLLVVPKTVDALPLTILTGSMEPSMPPGTLAVVQPTDPAKLRVDDVVTYQWESGDPTLVTHRIVEIRRSSNGGTTLIAQGDNNNKVDPPIQVEQVMGKVIYAVPYFGWITNNINSDQGRRYTKWAAYGFMGYGVVTFLAGLISLFRDRGGPQHGTTNRSHKGTGRVARARRRPVHTQIT